MSEASLANRCVVVTGAASGIGEATARAVVREGGSVVIADLQEDKGRALAEELGDAAVFIQTDVTRETDIADAVALAEERYGELYGMVNNAGVWEPSDRSSIRRPRPTITPWQSWPGRRSSASSTPPRP